MHDSETCRMRAADCVRLAQQARTAQHKALLLDIAGKWIELADQTAKVAVLLEPDKGVAEGEPPRQP